MSQCDCQLCCLWRKRLSAAQARKEAAWGYEKQRLTDKIDRYEKFLREQHESGTTS
jgi:hypothetical protein